MQSTPDLIHIGSLKSWTAPECTSINRVPMRATAYPFPTAQSARSVDRAKTPWFQSLNGQWQFKAADRPGNAVLTDIAVDGDRANWDSVEVPGNWTLQGYGAFPRQPEEGWLVEAQLFDPKGKAIFKKPLRSIVPAGNAFAWPRLQAEFDEPVKKPFLWSAELPHLYSTARDSGSDP